MIQQIYRPEILKQKIKRELNEVIKKNLQKENGLIQVKRLSKKAKHKFFREERYKLLNGKTIYGSLIEEVDKI